MALTAEHKHYDWWYALTAGLNERCSTGQGLAGLSDDFLKGMLAFDLANSVPRNENDANPSSVQPWRKDVMERQPDLAQDTYLAVARLRLSRNEQIADGIHELLTDAAFEPNRIDIVLDLLREYPNADPYRVDELLNAAAKMPAAHERTLALARSLLAGTALSERQRDLWLATAYALSPSEFEAAVTERAGVQSGFIFDLRDKSGFSDHAQPSHTPLAMLEFLTALAGRLYPEAPFTSEGWNGDHNPWDAAQWVRNLVSIRIAQPRGDRSPGTPDR
jgi:predicted NACHT family NTPase